MNRSAWPLALSVFFLTRVAYSMQPCPEGTQVAPLVLWGAPAVIGALGVSVTISAAKALRTPLWLRVALIGALTLGTLVGALLALGIASALGPCV